jgi:hypothetical protein
MIGEVYSIIFEVNNFNIKILLDDSEFLWGVEEGVDDEIVVFIYIGDK